MRYTVDQAAAALNITPEMIYKAMRLGYIPRIPHPNPPNPWTRWVLCQKHLDAYSREHRSRRGRKPRVIAAGATEER